jgi:hypothetical protein
MAMGVRAAVEFDQMVSRYAALLAGCRFAAEILDGYDVVDDDAHARFIKGYEALLAAIAAAEKAMT